MIVVKVAEEPVLKTVIIFTIMIFVNVDLLQFVVVVQYVVVLVRVVAV